MSPPLRLSIRTWLLVPLAAAAFIIWVNVVRVQRVHYVSDLAGVSAELDPKSPTGYAQGVRQIVVPEHNIEGYEWINQTQQMLAQRTWRVRHVDYDNAPAGRGVFSASPYRWWLGFMAWVDQLTSSRTIGAAVEQAALFADPALHLLLLIAAVVYVSRRAGPFPAAILAVGMATLFPFGRSFLAAQPQDQGLGLICIIWSVLPLVLGSSAPTGRSSTSRFVLAGMAGGLGLWINASGQISAVLGIAAGGLLAALTARPASPADAELAHGTACRDWRIWGVVGAATAVIAYLIEHAPNLTAASSWETNHPVYALAWWGMSEFVAQASGQRSAARARRSRREIIQLILAGVAVAAVPAVLFWQGSRGILAVNSLAEQLAPQSSFSGGKLGQSSAVVTALLPIIFTPVALWLLFRGNLPPSSRRALAIAIGAVASTILFAAIWLRNWAIPDATLLVLLTATTSVHVTRRATRSRWLWSGAVLVLVVIPGMLQLIPSRASRARTSVTEEEIVSLIERDLAHWLTNRAGAGKVSVLASPNLTAALIFHGGIRGLGTLYRENNVGLTSALRTASVTAQDEAMNLMERRELTHVVLASWDPLLEEYVRLASEKPEQTLVGLLQRWTPPRWLKAVPYTLPDIPGFNGGSVMVYEVVELQEPSLALSRLAECFVELRRSELAASVSEALARSFADDLSALVARATVWKALGDKEGLDVAWRALLPKATSPAAQSMLFDRRVSLAVVLAEGKRPDLAREQVQRCLTEADEPRLRSLTPLALYRLQILARAFALSWKDRELQKLARSLLPAEMREQLAR